MLFDKHVHSWHILIQIEETVVIVKGWKKAVVWNRLSWSSIVIIVVHWLHCKQEGIIVGFVLPSCINRTCFFNSHQMSTPEGSSSEQVWKSLLSCPPDISTSKGLYSEAPCPEKALYSEVPCPGGLYTVRSYVQGISARWGRKGAIQRYPMRHR